MIYITIEIASNTVAYRFLNFNNTIFLSSATLIFPITYFVTDIITEVFGYKMGKSVVWFGFICDFIFVFAIIIVIHSFKQYVPQNQNAYDYVFGGLLRVVSVSFIGVLSGQFINMYILSKWKIMAKGRYFWLRSIGSSVIGEFLLLLIACFGAFSGDISTKSIFKMIGSAYLLKITYALVLSAPAQFIATRLKRACGVDVYDYNTDFNPFSLSGNIK